MRLPLTLQDFMSLFVPAAVLSYLCIRFVLMPLSHRTGMLVDTPNERSLHQAPKARIGGIGILISALAALLALGSRIAPWPHWQILLGSITLALFVLSVIDDARSMSSMVRLACHVLAASALTIGLEGTPLPQDVHSWICLAAVVFCVSWWTNLNNFMDGADGMAGGMAVIGFAAFAGAFEAESSMGAGLSQMAVVISGASAGFLLLNFSPSRVFMGDAGAIPLGFLAAAFSWMGFKYALCPLWFGPVVFSAFIVDATVTLIRRIWAREPFWKAHRRHYYQRLILGGWSHRKTCFLYYFLMLWSTYCALSAKNSPQSWMWLVPLVLTYVTLIAVLEWRFHQEKQNGKNSGTG